MIPNPVAEFSRLLKAGREWYVQYMLASFFLGTVPANMNTSYGLHERGLALLTALDAHAFGGSYGSGAPSLFWEYRLLARDTDKENGWPDLAIEWSDRLLMMELKTEPGSVRDGQVDWYLALAAHHFPEKRSDLLFITKDPVAGQPPLAPLQRYATADWLDVAAAIQSAWGGADEHDGAAAWVFSDYLRSSLAPSSDRTTPARPAASPVSSVASDSRVVSDLDDRVRTALAEAAHVEADGRQRAMEGTWPDKPSARAFAVLVAERLRASAPHVRPWVAAVAAEGGQLFEVRLSYYQDPS